MEIEIRISSAELDENFIDAEHLRQCVIADLDDGREYPDFKVKIIIIE